VLTRASFALSLAALAAIPHPAAAQQGASAGSTRPKLQVLQALPEAQLFSLMNVVAYSLGVHCDYCHVQVKPDLSQTPSNVGGWVWDRDDKPQKQIARDMMRMVIGLNAGQFGGDARITCYTCHRGGTQPLRLPTLPPPPRGPDIPSVAAALPSADRIWTNYVDAVGQISAPAPGTGTIISGWDDRPEGRYGTVEIVLAGDRYRATVSRPAGTVSQGLDGDTAWVAANDRAQRLSGEDAARLRRIAVRYRPMRARPANLEVAGVEPVTGRDAYVVTAKIDAITTLTMYFDVVTGLLRREMTTTETTLLPLQEQVDYDDYRAVNGVQFPFHIRSSENGAPYATMTQTVVQIRRNVTVDAAVFQPPSARR
jgi:hypothetical protein